MASSSRSETRKVKALLKVLKEFSKDFTEITYSCDGNSICVKRGSGDVVATQPIVAVPKKAKAPVKAVPRTAIDSLSMPDPVFSWGN